MAVPDTDFETKKQAGIEKLNEYSNYYEIKEACKVFNCSQSELFFMDDGFVTKMLIGEKIYYNFEKNYNELMRKK